MMPVQFFLFGLFLVWFAGTGKLRALMEALRLEPQASSTPANGGAGQGNAIVPNPPLVGPTGPIEATTRPLGAEAVALATAQIGKKYVYGAPSNNALTQFAYDCSSLVQSVYGKLGKSLDRTTTQQALQVHKTMTPQAGDLVFASFLSTNDHVGIYAGGGKVVNALNEANGVVSSLVANWPKVWYGRVV